MASSLIRFMGAVNTRIANYLVPEVEISSMSADPDREPGKALKEYKLTSVYPSEEIRNRAMKYICEKN